VNELHWGLEFITSIVVLALLFLVMFPVLNYLRDESNINTL
jgi:hypothetical protein